MVVSSTSKPPLPEDGEVQHCARLGKDGPCVIVGDVTDVKIIDLEELEKHIHTLLLAGTVHVFHKLLVKTKRATSSEQLSSNNCMYLVT